MLSVAGRGNAKHACALYEPVEVRRQVANGIFAHDNGFEYAVAQGEASVSRIDARRRRIGQ